VFIVLVKSLSPEEIEGLSALLDSSTGYNIPEECRNLTTICTECPLLTCEDDESYVIAFQGIHGNWRISEKVGLLKKLKALRFLQLVGTIPSQIGKLEDLVNLDLSGEGLFGSIPTQIGNLKSLKYLQIVDSSIEGVIPSTIAKCANLTILTIENNPNLKGVIPWEIGCYLKQLTLIRLDHNDLSGTIPPQLGMLTNLQNLDLYGNQLSGTIPMELGYTDNRYDMEYMWCNNQPITQARNYIVELKLHNNNLTGTIPRQIANSSLEYLSLHQNRLVGTIPPELFYGPEIRYLELFENNLQGTIPPQIGASSYIYTLSLNDNKLNGTIPRQLGKLAKLALKLNNNQLEGTLPPELGDILSMPFFEVMGNRLTGTIPRSYCNIRIGILHIGSGLTGCWPNCTAGSQWNKYNCDASGSTFGCDAICGAPDGCNPNTCSVEYNYNGETPSSPESPYSLPSSPSVSSSSSPSSMNTFINTEAEILKKTRFYPFYKFNFERNCKQYSPSTSGY
jgi:Leucine-rich repeat (LRR) protein